MLCHLAVLAAVSVVRYVASEWPLGSIYASIVYPTNANYKCNLPTTMMCVRIAAVCETLLFSSIPAASQAVSGVQMQCHHEKAFVQSASASGGKEWTNNARENVPLL